MSLDCPGRRDVIPVQGLPARVHVAAGGRELHLCSAAVEEGPVQLGGGGGSMRSNQGKGSIYAAQLPVAHLVWPTLLWPTTS